MLAFLFIVLIFLLWNMIWMKCFKLIFLQTYMAVKLRFSDNTKNLAELIMDGDKSVLPKKLTWKKQQCSNMTHLPFPGCCCWGCFHIKFLSKCMKLKLHFCWLSHDQLYWVWEKMINRDIEFHLLAHSIGHFMSINTKIVIFSIPPFLQIWVWFGRQILVM